MSYLLSKLSLAVSLLRVSARCAQVRVEVRVPVMGEHHGAKQPVCQDGSSQRNRGVGWVCWLANSEPGQLETRIKGSGVRRIDCRDCISNTSS